MTRKTLVLLLASVLLVVAVVGGVVALGKSSIGDDERAAASGAVLDDAALQVARDEALAFFSLDYRTAEADVEKVLSLATGAFKEQYAANKAQVIAQVKQKKLVSTGSIPDGGLAVEFATATQARVLVVVDVSRTIGTKVDRLRNRARVVLDSVDGRWLVSGVNQVG